MLRRFSKLHLISMLTIALLLGCQAKVETATSTVPAFEEVLITYPPTSSLRNSAATRSVTRVSTASLTATAVEGILPTTNPLFTPQATRSTATPFMDHTAQHTVQRGETLTGIAAQYGTTVSDMQALNGIVNGQIIFVGQTLRVPDVTTTATMIAQPTSTPLATIPYSVSQHVFLPMPDAVNDVLYSDFAVLPPDVITHVLAIYAEGQTQGRNPYAFSRLGDSTIEPPHFFYRFDSTPYHLGEYAYLQRTITHYSGSFGYDNVSVQRGLHIWGALDPMWARYPCEAGEHMLACEIRLHNPSTMIIRLGSNDSSSPEHIRDSFEQVITYCLDAGVIPILGTKADRYGDYADTTNTTIRQLAAEYAVPLWDFDRVAQTLPDNGLISDRVHLSYFYAHDWRLERGFTTGHGLHNLTGLIMLDELRQVLPQ